MSDISKAVESLSPKQRAMFEALMEKKRQQRQSAKVGAQIPRRGEMDAIPLSFSQQRLWFLDQLAPGNPAYNMDRAIRLSGSLDVVALERSLNEVLRRHEVLRTTFSSRKGQPVQVITPELTLALPMVDLQALAEAEQQARMWQLVTEEAQRPFDLARDPLLRAALLRLAETEHVMLLTMHHIASDGWSMGILVRELMALYEGYAAGQPLPLPDLPIQYADYAVWQRDWLQGAAFEEKLGYWKSQLTGALAVVELPLDHPRPPVQSSRGARLSFPLLSAPLTNELKALGQRAGVTLFMTLLAAFDVLVYRYTGQSDVVVGTPVANRNRKELEGLIGFFVNTLVLRTDLSGNPTFRELLEHVRPVASGAFAQQDFPFEMLVEELQPRRDLSRNPLFQVMFALQNAPAPALEMAGLTLSPLDVDDGMARFDLLVSVWDVEQGLLGSFEYNTDLFEATTITRLAGHFQTLLQGIVAAPEQPICDLPLLTEAERQQVLVEWNTTTNDYGQTRCIHELFEVQVERTPDATVLTFPSTGSGHSQHYHLTYRELNRRANQLAHHLRALGVGPETRVGICVERSPEMVIGLYGILKAGAAYVPLDPAYPVERLAFMLADAKVPVLLTQETLASKLPPHQAQVLCLDADWATIARQSAHNPTVRLADENLAYVIYTSGSTGRPKGAMNTHDGIRNRLLWMQEAYQLGPADRVIQKTPFSFDVSVWEFFWPLLYGACLVVARPEGHKDSAYLIETIVEQHVTTMHFVPSMLQMFVDERGVEACRCLRRVICSGEALPFDLTGRFFACLEAELHNLYGPTEAAVDVTFWPCQRESERRVIPIGRPIANTQIYLLDAQLSPVPVGVPGELHIGGAGLARGYHRRPGLTAERFIPAPSFACSSGGETSARLYKTGDLARYLPHGDIEFLGRTDFQVKVRGFRIELGGTEAVLGEHPAIRETVVVAAPLSLPSVPPGGGEMGEGAGDGRAASWDSRLVAYVVPNQGQELLVDELRRFMLEKLPEYMVPSIFVTLEALPLSPNGKVDRRALPAPDGARPEMETVYVAPRGEAERAIAAIWREVLRVEQVGINDNFFDLGGHSLLVVQVHHQLTATFEKEFPMTDMFKYTTVAALAQHLSQAQEQTDIVQKTKARASARRASLRRRARSR